MTDDSNPRLSEVVQTQVAFTGFVQLNKALDDKYRRTCRGAFLPTETEHSFFRAIVRAARGELDQGRSNLLLVSPFGTGKTLDLVMVYDIFTSKGNKDVLQGFDQGLRNDLQALTSQGPYLVIPVVGTESPLPLSQMILNSFRQAVEAHPFLKNADPSRPFLVPTVYEQAVQWLRNVDKGNLTHLAGPLDTFLKDHPSHLIRTSLERALKENDFDAFELWRSGFQAVTGELPIGFGSASPQEVLESALPELRLHGIVGIVLLIDELSQYLKHNMRHEADVIRTLDPLIHWIHNTENCFSVVATQVPPEQFEGGESEASYQAWASLKGRFQIYQMNRKRYDRLIAKALKRKQAARVDPNRHPQMQDLCQVHATCFGSLREDRETIEKEVEGYYPLHPTVVAAIGYIADTFGQYDRSIFQYLDLNTEDGFHEFIKTHPVYLGAQKERLGLVTLDEIFRFFTRNWSNVEAVNDSLARASKRAEASIQNNPLAQRVLNLVTLLAFLERRAVLPTPTLEGIAEMLNVSADQQLEGILQLFSRDGYFVYDEEFGYRLESGGGPRPIEVERAIYKYEMRPKEITSTVVVDILKKYKQLTKLKAAPPFPIQESYEITVKNLKKKFQRDFVSGRELVEKASRSGPSTSFEGTLLIGTITRADTIDGKLYREAVNAANKLAEAGAIVALVRQPLSTFDQLIKRYEASKAVAEDQRLGTSETAKKKLEEALLQLLTALSKEYTESRLDWFIPANSSRPVRFDDAALAAEETAKKLTERFPSSITKQDVVGGQVLSEVVETLLNGGGQLEIRGLPGRVYIEALAPLGVVSIGTKIKSEPKQMVTLTSPDRAQPDLAESAEIWRIIEKALPLGCTVPGEEVHDRLQPLLHPPYWCPENLAVYLIAAYMGMHKAEVKGARDWNFHQPSIDEVKMLVRLRTNLGVRLPLPILLTSDQTVLVKSVAQAVAARLPKDAVAYVPNSLDPKSPEKAIAVIGEDLGRWYRDYGAYASQLIARYRLVSHKGQAFLKSVKEAVELQQLSSVDFYTRTLLSILSVSPHEAPLIVEQIIDGLTELSKMSNDINTAAVLNTATETIREAWEKFLNNCLDKELLRTLLGTVREYQTIQSSETKRDTNPSTAPPSAADASVNGQEKQFGEPIATGEAWVPNMYEPGSNGKEHPDALSTVDGLQKPDQSEFRRDASEENTSETISTPSLTRDREDTGTQDLGLTVEDLHLFAKYVLAMASQVQIGERRVNTLEEILQEYRDEMHISFLNRKGEHSI